jgi:transcriptional regulator with XRE-family HTH domain
MKIEILVREIRLKQNMTLETLAELSGISKGHLSKIERQEREPKLSTMIMIAKALKVDIEELYKIVK